MGLEPNRDDLVAHACYPKSSRVLSVFFYFEQ